MGFHKWVPLNHPFLDWIFRYKPTISGILHVCHSNTWLAFSRGVASNNLELESYRRLKESKQKLQHARKNYSILSDILVLFGDLTTGIPHKIRLKPREETKNSEGKLETPNKTQESRTNL